MAGLSLVPIAVKVSELLHTLQLNLSFLLFDCSGLQRTPAPQRSASENKPNCFITQHCVHPGSYCTEIRGKTSFLTE